jgi:hypothetical protein
MTKASLFVAAALACAMTVRAQDYLLQIDAASGEDTASQRARFTVR